MNRLVYIVIILLFYVIPTSAQEVYHDCSPPPSTFRNVWYFDPVNGKTAAAGGNGSKAAPWNDLQAIIQAEPGYTYPLLSTSPYRQVPVPGQPAIVAVGPKAGPIKPGDEILLLTGNYGNLWINVQGEEIENSEFVTIAAAPGQTPVLTSLLVAATSDWAFSGLKVQSLAPETLSGHALVHIVDGGANYPVTNIVLANMTVSSQDDVDAWSQAQWIANARDGFYAINSETGRTNCISMTGSHITNVRFGASLSAGSLVFSGNEIDHFGDDAIDYAASLLSITKNYIHDNLTIGDGNHNDAMQGQIGAPGAVHNYGGILIDSNTIIRQTDPNLQFPTYLQGIDAFDENWTSVTITNNVVITSACWGIAYASLHGAYIENNTVISDGLLQTAGGCQPAISVGDKTHEGSSSNDVWVRNNLANQISVYNLDPGVEADHNVGVATSGPVFAWYVNNAIQYYGNPGTYGSANIIAAGGPAAEFVDFDPSTLTYNVTLKAGAAAIGAGTAAGTPTVDILGATRTVPYSAGAYAYPN